MKHLAQLIFCVAVFSCGVAASAQSAAGYNNLIQQGKAQLQTGHPDQALASGEQAIKLDTKDWEGYALAGGALMNLKHYEEAADRLSEAIDRAPVNKEEGLRGVRRQCFAAELGAFAPAGRASAAADSTTESTTTQAEIVLWKSIEDSTNPDDFQVYLSQYPNGAFAALARHRMEQTPEAKQERAERVQQLLLEASALWAKGDKKGALAALDHAIAADPASTDAFALKGKFLLQSATYDFTAGKIVYSPECISALQKYLALSPGDNSSFAELAREVVAKQ